jgi:hypothetical protein
MRSAKPPLTKEPRFAEVADAPSNKQQVSDIKGVDTTWLRRTSQLVGTARVIFCSGNCPSTLKGKFACPMCLMPFGTKVPQKNACKHTREACINLQRSQHKLQDDELRDAWVDARGSHFVGPNSLCIVSADVARLAADTSSLQMAHDSLEERVVQLEGVEVPFNVESDRKAAVESLERATRALKDEAQAFKAETEALRAKHRETAEPSAWSMGRHRVCSPPEIVVNVIIEAAWPKEVKTLAPGEIRAPTAAADPSGQIHSAPYVEQYSN